MCVCMCARARGGILQDLHAALSKAFFTGVLFARIFQGNFALWTPLRKTLVGVAQEGP